MFDILNQDCKVTNFSGNKQIKNRFFLHIRIFCSNFGLRHYVSPEITFAKSCKWQNKMNFICTFGFFVVILQAKLQGGI